MSLYTALEHLKINGFLTVPNETISIYKITCSQTGHFYIGQAHDLQKRIYTHFMGILDAAKGIDAHGQSVWHTQMGQELMKSYKPTRKAQTLSIHVRASLDLYIIALAGDREGANVLEAHYIAQGMKSPLCLNKGVRKCMEGPKEMAPFKITGDNGEKVYLSQ